MLYYNLLFNVNFIKQLIQKMDASNEFMYITDYLVLKHPFNHLFNFFLKLYSIEKLRVVLNIDSFFSKYTKVFLNQFQPRLEKILKKKKLLFY